MLRGDTLPAQSSKSDFIFQLVSIQQDIVIDPEEEDVDEDDEEEKRDSPEERDFTVRMFGITEKSESVSVKIVGFTPYFYVRIPFELQTKFTKSHLRMFVCDLTAKVRKMFRESIIHSEIVMRKEFYGFTNERKMKFIRLRFRSVESMRAYSYVLKKPLKVSGVSVKELFYSLYESNIDPILRLCHIRDIKPVGWVKLPADNFRIVKKISRETRCQYEFVIDWDKIGPATNPNIGPMVVASFDIECVSMDGSFPTAHRKEDAVIQIGTTVHYHGQKDCFFKHIITLGKSDPIEGVVVESYETEREVLCAWTRLIQRLDPDILTGYNIWGFDLKYMYDRADLLGIKEEFCQLGRVKSNRSRLIEKTLQSSALGQNFFYILEMEGRVQIDLMKLVQKDYKLETYKLDAVAEYFLKMNKVDLSPKELFAKYKTGGSKNIREIAVYCVQDCELCNRLMNKLDVITNNVGMGNVCHVPLDWLFLRGQGVKIYSLVSRQCRLEEFVIRVQNKGADEDKGYEGAVVLVATPGIYMVPISVNDFASLYPSSMISENISHDSIVFFKILDNSGNIVNMVSGNCGWYSLPEFREYDRKGILDEELKKLGYKTNYIESDNYEGYYGDLTKKASEEDYDYHMTDAGKKVIGKTICCYVEKIIDGGKEEKSVIPRILENLLWERRVTRASAFYEEFHMKDGTVIDGNLGGPKEDAEYYYVAEYKKAPRKVLKADVVERKEKYNSFQQSILDGLQLAYKITANSLYGQVGAPTSPIYFKELASSTTATGRKLLKMARDITETNFPGARCVYGDTDSVFITFDQYWEKVLGLKLEGVEALKKSIELCKQAGKMVTASLKKPHDLEYEKTFFPFIQLAKKRYVGNLYEDDPHHFKQKSMGIVLKRRDNAMICKDIYGGIVDIILNKMDIHEAERFFKKSVSDLLLGRVDLSRLIITKALRADYKNPESIAHKMLADRMAERDPGNKPQSNDRIPYIFIQTRAPKKGEKILQGDKVEHPDYIKANPSVCKPDFMYYLNHQIKVPCIQLFALELEKLTGYRDGWMDESIIRKMREKNKTEMEIQEKIAGLRELETERLLLGDIVRTYTNTQSGYSKDITSYFSVRSGVDNTYIDEFALKPKEKVSLSVEAMKANIQKKEVEPAPIITKTESVKVAKAIRNVKESAKEAKKAEKESKKTEDKSLSELEKIAKSKIKRNNKLDIAIGSVLDL